MKFIQGPVGAETVSGTLGAALSHPADTLKTRLQAGVPWHGLGMALAWPWHARAFIPRCDLRLYPCTPESLPRCTVLNGTCKIFESGSSEST